MSPLPPREWPWPSLKLSYSDPTDGKFLQGTAGCAPHRTIGSQTRSAPSPSLLHPREGGSQTPLAPSFLLRFVQWEALAEDQTTSRCYSQDGFSSLCSALGTTVNTSPGQLILTQSTQPGDAARPACLTPLQAPEKEAGAQPKRGAHDISEELNGPPEDILHVGRSAAGTAERPGPTKTEEQPESTEPTVKTRPPAGTEHVASGEPPHSQRACQQ